MLQEEAKCWKDTDAGDLKVCQQVRKGKLANGKQSPHVAPSPSRWWPGRQKTVKSTTSYNHFSMWSLSSSHTWSVLLENMHLLNSSNRQNKCQTTTDTYQKPETICNRYCTRHWCAYLVTFSRWKVIGNITQSSLQVPHSVVVVKRLLFQATKHTVKQLLVRLQVTARTLWTMLLSPLN